MNDKTKKIESDYSKYIAMSRYARYQDGLDRRETWEETVTRLCDFWQKRYPDVFPYETIKNGVLNMEEMPSMRSLMTAGKALERDQVSGYNPVSGDTRIVTKEYGNIAIKNLENKSATVLNIDGRWTPATFRSYGKQKLFNVKLKLNSNTEKTVQCTENHRWVLNDRSVLSTKSLKKGDKIPFSFAPKPQIDKDYDLGIKHGIVYGDGTATKICERVKGYHVRLCGDSRELLRYFSDYPTCYPPSANGDPVVMMYDGFAATHSLKELPPNDETESYLLGFIRGWLAADGSITKTSQVSLCTSDPGLEWLKNNCEKLGFVVQRIYKQPSETNYGKRRQGSYVVYISRSSCIADDFLCSWKRKHFEELESHFSVSDVEETELFEEVFCAEVPDTNTFVIEGGLVTGNCSYLPINDPRCFDEAMYVLMCFHPDTEIITKSGNKKIRDLQIGDTVLSFSESTKTFTWEEVLNVIQNDVSAKTKLELIFEDGTKICCTHDHQWLTQNGWVKAEDLTEMHDIITPKFWIYRIQNQETGKSYIGYTSKSIQERMNEHLRDCKRYNHHFAKALKKYPDSVWKIEAIDFAFSQEEAIKKEMKYIALFETKKTGYNSTDGGEGTFGYSWAEEQKLRASENAYERTDAHREAQKKIIKSNLDKITASRQTAEYKKAQRERNLGAKNPAYGRKHSEERKKQLSENMKGDKNPFFGKNHSLESKEKIKQSLSARRKSV